MSKQAFTFYKNQLLIPMVVSQGPFSILRNIEEEILEINIRFYLEYDVCLVHCSSNKGVRKKEMSSELRDVSGGESVVSLSSGCTYFFQMDSPRIGSASCGRDKLF